MSRDAPFENRQGLMGPGWSKIRARQLRKHRLCQWPGCTERATEVDHLVARFEAVPGMAPVLQSLCHPHHARKTAEEGHRAWEKQKAETAALFDFTEQHPGMQ